MRLWVLLTCPFLSGCLAFAYPAISRTPEVAIEDADVRAFRVMSNAGLRGQWIIGPFKFDRQIDEIPVAEATVISQHDAYFAYSYFIFPILGGSRNRNLEVLLYRPGYEVVNIPARSLWGFHAWDKAEPIVWKKASDLYAEKEAVDRLVGGPPWDKKLQGKSVVQYAASEYARLAKSSMAGIFGMGGLRNQLLELAKEYDELASKREQ